MDAHHDIVRIVGIGASAGGLDALRDMMQSLPDSGGLCYAIAQHVSPAHISMLMDLLTPFTQLKVQYLHDQQPPQAGTVYITPPNSDVSFEGGVFRLTEPRQAIGPKPSVNYFFQSLADELGEQAIGIILSGTGSDGASGMRAIKAAGGITIVQDPATAKYDGMPKAAIYTDSVDLILAASKIGPALARLLLVPGDIASVLEEDRETEEYLQIGKLVRRNTAFKLSDYKPGTVRRRIARRMNILGMDSLAAYIDYLQSHKDESLFLMRDTFISVTSFFRDKEAFCALEGVINALIRNEENKKVLRIWVPGCASGEEVYSIAMLFEEALLTQQKQGLQYMIFASDLDDGNIERARAALYPVSELDAVPKRLRERYMEVVGDHCRVIKRIRNRVVFAHQNVIDDSPFARLDLISCRNLLIYFNPPAQKRVLGIFHYALNSGGYLFLGKSETADLHRDWFEVVDSRAHIYRRQDSTSPYVLPATQGMPYFEPRSHAVNKAAAASVDKVGMKIMEALAERYGPPSLVITDDDVVVNFHGDLKAYLNFPKGRATMHLFDMVDESVRAELRALVYQCRRDLTAVQGTTRTIQIEDKSHALTLVVSPLEPEQRALLLVSFVTSALNHEKAAQTSQDAGEMEAAIIRELEKEIANTRSHLNTVTEELETSNEELQSLNEELQSANEELQSTNEELQTSNEELQSTNEELITVNDELQVKTAELEASTSDLVNVKQSLAFPLIVVDEALRITQINDACGAIIALDGSLAYHSLGNIKWRIEIPELADHVRHVMQGGQIYQAVIHSGLGTAYRLHIMPYRIARSEIAGAVLIFEDITAQQQAEKALQESVKKFSQAMFYAATGMAIVAPGGDWIEVNPALCQLFGYSQEELLATDVQSLIHEDDLVPAVAAARRLLSGDMQACQLEIRYLNKNGAVIWTQANISIVRNAAGVPEYFIAQIQDITARKLAEDELRLAASVFSNTLDGILIATPEGMILKVNHALEKILGYGVEEVINQHIGILRSDRHDADFYRAMWNDIQDKGLWQGEIWSRHKDGHYVPVWLSISSLCDQAGQVERYIIMMYDITEQKLSQARIAYLAHYDELTDLPNRALFIDRLEHALAKAKRECAKLALLFIDLDNFKQINDTRGHPVGDELLKGVAQRLVSITRESDTVARLSGDEFTLLIENPKSECDVYLTAQKILTMLSQPFELTDGEAYVSASMGIALFPDDGSSSDILLKYADLAMYRSKEAGRNRYHFYRQEMSDAAQERMILDISLRQAIDRKELELFYQPIMDVKTRRCVGAEALIRWHHRELGYVQPAKFIPVAEESNLILSLGEWVFHMACRQMSLWLEAGLEVGSLAVNVSGKQLAMGNFVSVASRTLKETGCPSERIVLELTESFIMRESQGAIQTLEQLRALGFGIAIDDFGTGYSSLSYLRRLPVSKLKLDQSFVRDIPEDPNDAAIARAILALGETLGLEVVAEGVETEAQHQFLVRQGGALSQGFFYSKPLTRSAFENFFMNARQSGTTA